MEKIDCTPTWVGLAPALIAVAQDGSTSQGRRKATDEIRHMAQVADLAVPLTKENKELKFQQTQLTESRDFWKAKFYAYEKVNRELLDRCKSMLLYIETYGGEVTENYKAAIPSVKEAIDMAEGSKNEKA